MGERPSDDFRRMTTARLELRAVDDGDVDLLFDLLSDPRVWSHRPSAVHTDRRRTAAQVARYAADWRHDGLGYWTAWLADGTFVGTGGCVRRRVGDGPTGDLWNLYYRVAADLQRQGYATELARAGRAAAAQVAGDLPVVAVVLAHNVASRAVAEAAGLHLVRGGPGGDGGGRFTSVLFADRPVPAGMVAEIGGG